MGTQFKPGAGSALRGGAAALELAIVLPLLTLLLLGATDFGRFAHTQIAAAGAARGGAGQASQRRPTTTTRPQWEAAIRQAVRDEMEGLNNFDPSQLNVQITTIDEAPETMRAAIEVTYPFHTLVTWGLIPSEIQIRETVEFRMLD